MPSAKEVCAASAAGFWGQPPSWAWAAHIPAADSSVEEQAVGNTVEGRTGDSTVEEQFVDSPAV